MPVPDPLPERKSLVSLELWQLALILIAFVVLVGHFLLGAALPAVGKPVLVVLLLVVVLGSLLVARARKRKAA